MFVNVKRDSVEWDVLSCAAECLEWQYEGLCEINPDEDEYDVREDTIHTIVTSIDMILEGISDRILYTWDWDSMSYTEKEYRIDELETMVTRLKNKRLFEAENYYWLTEDELEDRKDIYSELIRMISGIISDGHWSVGIINAGKLH